MYKTYKTRIDFDRCFLPSKFQIDAHVYKVSDVKLITKNQILRNESITAFVVSNYLI